MAHKRRLKVSKANVHHYVFPYVPFHGKSYPLIPITLKRGVRRVNTFALLDSGASVSVFRPEISKALGLNPHKEVDVRLETASGEVDIQIAEVDVQIERTHFKADVGFSGKYAANFNIIGRQGFFHRFSICFNEMTKTVVLVPLSQLR